MLMAFYFIHRIDSLEVQIGQTTVQHSMKVLIELCSELTLILSSLDSLCHFECGVSFSELITLPIKVVTLSGRALYLHIYSTACRQGEDPLV